MRNKISVNSSDNEQSTEVNAVPFNENEINGDRITDTDDVTGTGADTAAEANAAADNVEEEDADADAYDDAEANTDDNSDSDSSDDDLENTAKRDPFNLEMNNTNPPIDDSHYQDPKVLVPKIAELEERLSKLETILNTTVIKGKKTKKVKCKCKGKKVDISKCKCKRKKEGKK